MLASASYQTLVGPFGYYNRTIHDQIAWKVYQTYGYAICSQTWGVNINTGGGALAVWEVKARTLEIPVGNEPKVGSVAIKGVFGWVESIDPNGAVTFYGVDNSGGDVQTRQFGYDALLNGSFKFIYFGE